MQQAGAMARKDLLYLLIQEKRLDEISKCKASILLPSIKQQVLRHGKRKAHLCYGIGMPQVVITIISAVERQLCQVPEERHFLIAPSCHSSHVQMPAKHTGKTAYPRLSHIQHSCNRGSVSLCSSEEGAMRVCACCCFSENQKACYSLKKIFEDKACIFDATNIMKSSAGQQCYMVPFLFREKFQCRDKRILGTV